MSGFVDKDRVEILKDTNSNCTGGNINILTGLIPYLENITSDVQDQIDTINSIIGEIKWTGETTSNATTEIFIDGISPNRLDIDAQSSLGFTIIGACRDNTNHTDAFYEFQGVIRRDNLNNTTINVNKIEHYSGDINFNINVDADDTNEALIITVNGHTVNTTKFEVKLIKYCELNF